MTVRVWTYWEGPKSAWIELCLESIVKNIPGVEVLTPESWSELWTETDKTLIDSFNRQRPNVKSDFIRSWLLANIGGIWIDADAIVFRDVRPVYDRLTKRDFVAYRVGPPSVQLCSALLAGDPQSVIGAKYHQYMVDKLLSTKRRVGTIALGPNVLRRATAMTTWQELGETNRRGLYRIPKWRVHPIHFLPKFRYLYREQRPDEYHQKWWRSFLRKQMTSTERGYYNPDRSYCAMLTHRMLGPLRWHSKQQLLDGDSLASWLYRKAFDGSPAT